jgi:hypothetical protein
MLSSVFPRLFRPRRRKPWSEVSTPVVFVLALLTSLEASYFTYVIGRFGPEFLRIADAAPLATWTSCQFFLCVAILAAIGVQAIVWGVSAAGMLGILQKRFFDI